MNPLEKEILKYQAKGFEIEKKRTLKYGTRVYLKKSGFLGFEGICLYYLDGNLESESIRECLKDYAKFYETENFGDGDKGVLMVSGNADEKLFRDFKKAMVRDDDIRNSIKLIKVGNGASQKETQIETRKTMREKSPSLSHSETEKIIHRVGTNCCYPNCDENIALDVHHITPREEGGTNDYDNLIVLCPSHHRLADRGAIPRKRLELYCVARMEEKRL